MDNRGRWRNGKQRGRCVSCWNFTGIHSAESQGSAAAAQPHQLPLPGVRNRGDAAPCLCAESREPEPLLPCASGLQLWQQCMREEKGELKIGSCSCVERAESKHVWSPESRAGGSAIPSSLRPTSWEHLEQQKRCWASKPSPEL